MKKTYVQPQLSELGSFETLTQGASTGARLDATFPTNTAFGDLTFS